MPRDFNGDGKNDQFGLNTTSIRFMLPLNGVVGFGSPVDNKFTVDLFDQPSINALRILSIAVGRWSAGRSGNLVRLGREYPEFCQRQNRNAHGADVGSGDQRLWKRV